MENRTKTNDQLFDDYYNLITSAHTPKSLYEVKRLQFSHGLYGRNLLVL